MKSIKRTAYDKDLHPSFRWVRVGEHLKAGDEARDYLDGKWGRTGRAGQLNYTSKGYRRHL